MLQFDGSITTCIVKFGCRSNNYKLSLILFFIIGLCYTGTTLFAKSGINDHVDGAVISQQIIVDADLWNGGLSGTTGWGVYNAPQSYDPALTACFSQTSRRIGLKKITRMGVQLESLKVGQFTPMLRHTGRLWLWVKTLLDSSQRLQRVLITFSATTFQIARLEASTGVITSRAPIRQPIERTAMGRFTRFLP